MGGDVLFRIKFHKLVLISVRTIPASFDPAGRAPATPTLEGCAASGLERRGSSRIRADDVGYVHTCPKNTAYVVSPPLDLPPPHNHPLTHRPQVMTPQRDKSNIPGPRGLV